MIELFAKIDISKHLTERIQTTESEARNNISATRIPVGVKEYKKPFILGSSKLGEGGVFADSTEVFIGNVLSDENGNFPTPYTFYFLFPDKLESYEFVSVAFDTEGGEHPRSIKVDGVEVFDDDAIFNFKLAKTSNSQHTLEIGNWNRSNSPIIISGIYSVVKAKIDRRNALSIEGNISQRGDFKMPDYGIYSSSGRIDFVDKNGEYADYAAFGLLTDGCKTYLHLRNTLDRKANERPPIAVYYTTNWSYDANSREVSVSLTDGLEVLQEVQADAYFVGGEMSMYDVYIHLKGESEPYLDFSELSDFIKIRLENTKFTDVMMSQKTLWAQWNDFCVANALYMFSRNGEVEFSYNSNGD